MLVPARAGPVDPSGGARLRKAVVASLGWLLAHASLSVRRVRARSLGIAGWLLILGSVALFLQNPDRRDLDAAVIVTVASLLGLALSIAFAATLLLAQHMSERHARSVLAEFRRDRSWIFLLALLAASVCVAVAAALQQPTMSTGWSSFLLLAGVFLVAGDRYPSLLDTLDPVLLTARMSDRAIRDLVRDARVKQPLERDKRLVASLQQGVERVTGVARQAIKAEDPEVLRAALDGVRRQLAAYMKSVSLISIEDSAADFTLQRLELTAQMAWETSTVVLLPAAVQEVRRIGLDAAEIHNPLNRDWEPLTYRICELLGEMAKRSLVDDRSAAPGMATAAIGDVARQLVRSGRPTPAGQHIELLEALAVGTIGSNQSAVTLHAVHGLAQVADEAARSPVLGEAAGIYEKACRAVISTASAYRGKPRKMLGSADSAVLPVVGPLAYPNLASLMLLGVAAERSQDSTGDYVPGWARFDDAAAGLFDLALGMAFDPAIHLIIRSDAGMVVYSALAGLMAMASEPSSVASPDLLETWWSRYLTSLSTAIDNQTSHHDDLWRFGVLTLFALYNAAEPSRPEAVRSLGLVRSAKSVLPPGLGRADVDALWRTAGAAALAIGADDLAVEIAKETPAPPRRDPERPWREKPAFFRGSPLSASLVPPPLMRGVPSPKWLTHHEDHRLQADVLALIDKEHPRVGRSARATNAGRGRSGASLTPRRQPPSSRGTS